MGKKKHAASISTGAGFAIGASDVIRWDDTMEINGHAIQISKAVELGLEYKLNIASKLERDLKGEGLFITFPLGILMSQLQERIEKDGEPHATAGEKLLGLVKAE